MSVIHNMLVNVIWFTELEQSFLVFGNSYKVSASRKYLRGSLQDNQASTPSKLHHMPDSKPLLKNMFIFRGFQLNAPVICSWKAFVFVVPGAVGGIEVVQVEARWLFRAGCGFELDDGMVSGQRGMLHIEIALRQSSNAKVTLSHKFDCLHY